MVKMTDIQTMKDMLAGLEQKKKNLEADEKVFLKLSGINEQIEKCGQEKDKFESYLTDAKKRQNEAKKKKAAAVSKTTSQIVEKMNQVLPFGKAVFNYDEDDEGKRSMLIGWEKDGVIIPYNGMSGMQQKVFDAALANVLDADIIVVEAAELDPENLKKTIFELAKLDKNVIINTWYPIDFEIPENFIIMEV